MCIYVLYIYNVYVYVCRHGDVRNMSSLANGDLVIEYDTHQEAESAMSIGAVYEGQAMKLQWYSPSVGRSSGGSGYADYGDQISFLLGSTGNPFGKMLQQAICPRVGAQRSSLACWTSWCLH